jgi:hypothetical protein
MPTKPNLGEFVERNGELYFIKAENLPATLDKPQAIGIAGQPGIRSNAKCVYILGYAIGLVVLIPILCLVVLFPVPLFTVLIGTGALKFVQER